MADVYKAMMERINGKTYNLPESKGGSYASEVLSLYPGKILPIKELDEIRQQTDQLTGVSTFLIGKVR